MRIVIALLSALMLIGLAGCSNKSEPATDSVTETVIVEDEAVADESVSELSPTKDFEGSYSDMGSGTFYVSTPAGTSEAGQPPVLYASVDSILIQIGYDAKDFNGGLLSYIYIDGIETQQEQFGEHSQGSLNLQGDALSAGIHTVEVVQYENDDTNGTVVTYKTTSYEVKEKS